LEIELDCQAVSSVTVYEEDSMTDLSHSSSGELIKTLRLPKEEPEIGQVGRERAPACLEFRYRIAPPTRNILRISDWAEPAKSAMRNTRAEPTLARVLDAYLASPESQGLAPRTRQVWRHIVGRIRARWGETPTESWSDPRRLSDIIRWRNEYSHQPRTADHQITVLNHLLGWARLNDIIHLNVAANIRRLYKNGARAEIIWLEEEIERFCNAAPPAVADGMRLAAKTGLRRADLIGLTWAEVELLRVKRVTLKSGRRRKRAMIPVTPDLRALLDELSTRPRRSSVNTVLVNSRGKSWSGDGFGHRFNEVRDDLDIRHTDGRLKHLHDVRGTYATRLVRLGLSDQNIGDIMGWSAQQVGEIRKIYVEDDAAVQAIIDRLTAADP
jgi:integrase